MCNSDCYGHFYSKFNRGTQDTLMYISSMNSLSSLMRSAGFLGLARTSFVLKKEHQFEVEMLQR